jgi:hypothetical protein
MSEQPATSRRNHPARRRRRRRPGARQQVAEQTDSDLEVEGAFEREADGAATDVEAAKATGDDLA